ncbi:hypothetical protein BS17DRAFT_784362 [Gyrodon lividus]|nr:hypothetical protein BS17DRAFT_784362 [Gyrodon lividus]
MTRIKECRLSGLSWNGEAEMGRECGSSWSLYLVIVWAVHLREDFQMTCEPNEPGTYPRSLRSSCQKLPAYEPRGNTGTTISPI